MIAAKPHSVWWDAGQHTFSEKACPERGWQNRSDWPKSEFDSDFDPRWLKKWKSDPESDFDRVFGFVLILILILILIRKVILFLILILKVILILILILRPFFKCLFWLVVRAYVILLQVDLFLSNSLFEFICIYSGAVLVICLRSATHFYASRFWTWTAYLLYR